eukprot:Opistho-2@44202
MDPEDKENVFLAVGARSSHGLSRRNSTGILKAGPTTPVKRGALSEVDPNSNDVNPTHEEEPPAKRQRRDSRKSIDRRVSFAPTSQMFYFPPNSNPNSIAEEHSSPAEVMVMTERPADGDNETMEFTSAGHGGILAVNAFTARRFGQASPAAPAAASYTNDENEEDSTMTMEFTSVHGGILEARGQHPTPGPSQVDRDEATMEFTGVHGGIIASRGANVDGEADEGDDAGSTMDFTSVHGGILSSASNNSNNESNDGMEESTMEFTSVHSGILSSARPLEREEEGDTMELTEPVGQIVSSVQIPAQASPSSEAGKLMTVHEEDDNTVTMDLTRVGGRILCLRSPGMKPSPRDIGDLDEEDLRVFDRAQTNASVSHVQQHQQGADDAPTATVMSGDMSGSVGNFTQEFTGTMSMQLSSVSFPAEFDRREDMTTTAQPTPAAHAKAESMPVIVPTFKNDGPSFHAPSDLISFNTPLPARSFVPGSVPHSARRSIDVLAASASVLFSASKPMTAPPTPSAAASSMQQGPRISLSEFLLQAGVSFLDNLSSQRRTTMAVGATQPPADLTSLSERLRIKSVVMPELALMEWGCDNLTETTDTLRANSQILDKQLSAANPAIFAALSSGSNRASLQESLKKLKGHARLETKLKRYEWQCKLESALSEELEDNAAMLKEDAERMRMLDARADQSIRELGSRREWLGREVRRMERFALAPNELVAMAQIAEEARDLESKIRMASLSLDTAKGYASSIAGDVEKAKAEGARLSSSVLETRARISEESREYSPSLVEAAAEECEMTEALAVFSVDGASAGRMRFAFLEGHVSLSVHLDQSAPVGGQGEVPVSHCAFELSPTCDDITRCLFAASGVEQILPACTHSKAIRPVVDAIARRLSRAWVLESEVRALSAQHHVVSISHSGSDCTIAVRLVNAKACVEFEALSTVNPCAYPFGRIASDVHILEGASAPLAQQLLPAFAASIDACSGYARLTSAYARMVSSLP